MFAYLTSVACVVVGLDTTRRKLAEDAVEQAMSGMAQPCMPELSVERGEEIAVALLIVWWQAQGL